MSADPQRLIDDPAFSAMLRTDLELAAQAGVNGLDLGAGAARLRGALAAEPVAAGGTAVATASVTGKVLVASVVVGGLVGLWAMSGGDAAEPKAEVVTTAPHSAPPGAELVDEPAPPAPLNAPKAAVLDEEDIEDVVDTEPDDTPAPVPVATPPVAEKRKNDQEHHAKAPDHRREAELVARARRSLADDPDLALRLTTQLGEEFPTGMLVEEREAIAIRALARLGRQQQARRLAEAFLVDHGEGPHADAIRRAVGL